MPLVLVSTVGGPGSNSYQDATGVQAVLDGVPNADAWVALAGNAPQQALICVHATTLMEALAYQGQKVAVTQALSWPRQWVEDPDFGDIDGPTGGLTHAGVYGVYLSNAVIPRRILRAHAFLCLEIARAGTSDVWGIDATLNVHRKQVDVIVTEYVDVAQRRIGLRKFPTVWTALWPLTRAAKPQMVERA